MPCFSLAVISAFGRRHEAGICLSMPMVGPPFIATTASHVTYRLSSTTPLKLEPEPSIAVYAPRAKSRVKVPTTAWPVDDSTVATNH
jgi:hypothetical protein